MAERLFHYCCKHSQRIITRYGTLLPTWQVFGGSLVWLTDMDVPDAEGLGLTSHIQPCNRLEFRYVVKSSADIVPWLASKQREQFGAEYGPIAVSDFEHGRMPSRWFVSAKSLAASQDRTYAAHLTP